jgi:hypothetical protein
VDVNEFFCVFEEGKVVRSKRKKAGVRCIDIKKKAILRCHSLHINDGVNKHLKQFFEKAHF